MRPIRHAWFFQAQAIKVPVVSFRTAITSILISPRRAIASYKITSLAHSLISQLISIIKRTWRSLTTSSPSTPEHLNPLVQVANRALVKPSWLQGKLKVKPRGNGDTSTMCSCIKVAKHSAMWSNNCRWKEINIKHRQKSNEFIWTSTPVPGPSMTLWGTAKIFDSCIDI